MKQSARLVLILLAVGVFMAMLLGRDTAAFDLDDSFSGRAQLDGPLTLTLTVSPPVSAPGDVVLLTVQLQNQMKVSAAPDVILRLPPGLGPDTGQMPAGVTINLQTRTLNWLPILPANGGQQQIEVALRVETADIAQPAQAVTAVLRYEASEQAVSAPIWIGTPPHIDRILPLPPVAVGQPVQLLAELSGSGPVAQAWDLGDGRRVDVNDPVVAYAAAGAYTVTLDAANPLAAVTQTATITVLPQPAAQFTLDDFTPGAGQAIHFRNESGGQHPLAHRWDFGDGTTTTEASPTHQYDLPGIYDVHLIVENEYGQSEAFWQVLVGAPPIADMEIDASAPAGQPLTGQAYGDDTVTVFRWNMGDGHEYEGAFVSHAYRRTGDFYVSMTAENEFGGTEIGRWVHVDPGQLNLYLPLVLRLEGPAGDLSGDPYELILDPVELAEPFALEPMTLPQGVTPAEQLFLYINEARRQFDLPPLNFVPELSQAAQQHVDDMIVHRYSGHIGFDGSVPAERLLWQGYQAGYAGEATAWGFEHPYQAVEFWINSPSHRRIILNQYATDVGAGFRVDFNAPNVWYWTAEFGNAFAAVTQPFVRLGQPTPTSTWLNSDTVVFSWNWPLPLSPKQQFTVYRWQDDTAVPVGVVIEPQLDTLYSFTWAIGGDWDLVGEAEWQVVLEGGAGASLQASERRPIIFAPDPDLPTPTPVLTPTVTPTPTPPPVDPTPTPLLPVNTPQPTLPPPIVITATPGP